MREMNSADRRMKKSRIFFGVTAAILLAIAIILIVAKVGFGAGSARTNKVHTDSQRVFDDANMLTEAQEKELQEKIETVEKSIHADIVIVTMNESIEDMYPDLTYDRDDEDDAYEGIRRYTNNYWDQNGFGWNSAGDTGNGIIMVDNVYRESNGYVYNWVAGSGDLRYGIGNDPCQKLSQQFTDRLPNLHGTDPLSDMSVLKTSSMEKLNEPYNEAYFSSLMSFVNDCDSLGNKLNGRVGWQAFTPAGIVKVLSSHIIMMIASVLVLVVLLSRMAYYSSSENVSGQGLKKAGFNSKAARTLRFVFMVAVVIVLLIVANAFAAVIAMVAMEMLFATIDSKSKPKKKGNALKTAFAHKEYLSTAALGITAADILVRSYTTHVTNSSSSGGGGGHGGGGGGGHSGGGSHR